MRECFFALSQFFKKGFAVDRRYSPSLNVVVSAVQGFLHFPNCIAVTRRVCRVGFHFSKVEGAWFDVNRRSVPELCSEGGSAVDMDEARYRFQADFVGGADDLAVFDTTAG